jgi:hypothetical protein
MACVKVTGKTRTKEFNIENTRISAFQSSDIVSADYIFGICSQNKAPHGASCGVDRR